MPVEIGVTFGSIPGLTLRPCCIFLFPFVLNRAYDTLFPNDVFSHVSNLLNSSKEPAQVKALAPTASYMNE